MNKNSFEIPPLVLKRLLYEIRLIPKGEKMEKKGLSFFEKYLSL